MHNYVYRLTLVTLSIGEVNFEDMLATCIFTVENVPTAGISACKIGKGCYVHGVFLNWL